MRTSRWSPNFAARDRTGRAAVCGWGCPCFSWQSGWDTWAGSCGFSGQPHSGDDDQLHDCFIQRRSGYNSRMRTRRLHMLSVGLPLTILLCLPIAGTVAADPSSGLRDSASSGYGRMPPTNSAITDGSTIEHNDLAVDAKTGGATTSCRPRRRPVLPKVEKRNPCNGPAGHDLSTSCGGGPARSGGSLREQRQLQPQCHGCFAYCGQPVQCLRASGQAA